MKRFKRVKSVLLVLSLPAAYCLLPAVLSAQQNIGSVTAVKKEVRVTHPGQGQVVLVKSGDGVLFLDTYETPAEGRAKLLFEDDSLLTLGEKTRLQITENIYDPAKNRRSATMKVLAGRVRVLVGKTFTGAGSKFEIHTPTAVAAARGTYYLVWLFEQAGKTVTGVAAVEGQVEVGNIDPNVRGTTLLGPNQFTLVSTGLPPTDAAIISLPLLTELLTSTEAKEESKESIPSDLTQPGADLIADPATIFPPVGPLSLLALEASTLPAIPPILQQPSLEDTTLVDVEVRFP